MSESPTGRSPAGTSSAPTSRSLFAAAAAAASPAGQAEPAPFTNGVIQAQSIAAIPGSSEPMKPVRVKTVQIKAGQMKWPRPVGPAGHADHQIDIAGSRRCPGNISAIMAKAESNKVDVARTEMPPQPANHGTGNGLLGVLPASSVPSSAASQTMAYADPSPHSQPQQNGAKPVAVHAGWIIQVGALESESEARQHIEVARDQAHGLLSKADSFTEPVVAKGDRKLYRARFAGLDNDQAEAVCRTLRRSDISCFTIWN